MSDETECDFCRYPGPTEEVRIGIVARNPVKHLCALCRSNLGEGFIAGVSGSAPGTMQLARQANYNTNWIMDAIASATMEIKHP